jgi:hypothetical protein
MWQKDLLEYLRGLEPEERAKVSLELLKVTQSVLAELGKESPTVYRTLRSAEFCTLCPFAALGDF